MKKYKFETVFRKKLIISENLCYNSFEVLWKGGRVVECSGFENQRGFTVTGGSNPSLSEKTYI